jgi:hypothetical protein
VLWETKEDQLLLGLLCRLLWTFWARQCLLGGNYSVGVQKATVLGRAQLGSHNAFFFFFLAWKQLVSPVLGWACQKHQVGSTQLRFVTPRLVPAKPKVTVPSRFNTWKP